MAIAMARKEDHSHDGRAVGGPAKLSMVVGENLRHLRRKQGLSLEQLAAISGVSRAMLGQIETGKSAPTINLLGRIADALQVSVSGLIANPGAGGTIVVPRASATIVASGEGGFVSRALFPWGDHKSVEIYEVTIAPRHSEVFTASSSGDKKNLVVISGDVEVAVGEDSPARLCRGDAILFNADAPHRILNPGDVDAIALLVLTSFEAAHSRARPG
jgi:transcriptional regulator with XRE-family HTH domain